MIDKTPSEQEALKATLLALGEIADEIGFNKSLSHYTREEALRLIEVVVTAYQDNFLENLHTESLLENREAKYVLEGGPFDV